MQVVVEVNRRSYIIALGHFFARLRQLPHVVEKVQYHAPVLSFFEVNRP